MITASGKMQKSGKKKLHDWPSGDFGSTLASSPGNLKMLVDE